ncbi:MAG: plasmid stabilization protein [Deltaproteobacteria bacterium RIFCSPLOWO2_02_FULL_53_8]|nr:MAG: plasmid stabilization protein [Deltaproteobacteria bacterium RIFCSPLOWO2_02_FULL_53_8]
MNIRVLACAELEFVESVDYYNEQRSGLGFEFAAEVKNTLERIRLFPDAWPLLSNRTRRCITNRFPYGIIYQVRHDMVLVVAIMHLKREPKIWHERVK